MRPERPGVMIRKGAGIGAKYLNDISARADLAASAVGINGVGVRVERGRMVISGEKGLYQPAEPGIAVKVVNTGTVDLDIYAVAGLGDNYYTSRPRSMSSRVFEVQEPEPYNAGEFVITMQPIPQNHTGLAWFSGICIARLVRQFDGPLLNRADSIAGEQALRASINGPVRILWEETTDPEGEALDPEEEHLAVIHWDGRGDTYLDWHCGGAGDIDHGCPAVVTGGGPGITGGRLAMVQPFSDGAFFCMVNVGGTVAVGDNGKVITGIGPVMACLDGVADALSSCGTLAATPSTFCAGSIFWRVLGYLGTNVAGEHWAIIQRDTTPSLLKATSEVIGDMITCEVSTEDGITSGVPLNMPVPWEP